MLCSAEIYEYDKNVLLWVTFAINRSMDSIEEDHARTCTQTQIYTHTYSYAYVDLWVLILS